MNSALKSNGILKLACEWMELETLLLPVSAFKVLNELSCLHSTFLTFKHFTLYLLVSVSMCVQKLSEAKNWP